MQSWRNDWLGSWASWSRGFGAPMMVNGSGKQQFETRRLGEGHGSAPATSRNQSFATKCCHPKQALAQLTCTPHGSLSLAPSRPASAVPCRPALTEVRARSSLTPCGWRESAVTNGRFAAGRGAWPSSEQFVRVRHRERARGRRRCSWEAKARRCASPAKTGPVRLVSRGRPAADLLEWGVGGLETSFAIDSGKGERP